MKKAVIFDMDGTLWDSVDEIVESWNKTCPEMHIRREQLIGLMGKTMDCFAKELLAQYELDQAMEIIHACERDENEYLSHVGAKLYGDVRKVFESLRDMGYEIGIVSNCQAGYIEVFLEATGLGHYFKGHLCPGDTGKAKADNIRTIIEQNHLQHAVYVGDTDGDYKATREAGIPFVHAAYGFGQTENPDYTITSPMDLVTLFVPEN